MQETKAKVQPADVGSQAALTCDSLLDIPAWAQEHKSPCNPHMEVIREHDPEMSCVLSAHLKWSEAK